MTHGLAGAFWVIMGVAAFLFVGLTTAVLIAYMNHKVKKGAYGLAAYGLTALLFLWGVILALWGHVEVVP